MHFILAQFEHICGPLASERVLLELQSRRPEQNKKQILMKFLRLQNG